MHDKVGLVAEVTESFGQKAKVAMPGKLVGADSKVGMLENFHRSARKKESPLFSANRSFLGDRFSAYLLPVNLPLGIRFQKFCDRAACQPGISLWQVWRWQIFFIHAHDSAEAKGPP